MSSRGEALRAASALRSGVRPAADIADRGGDRRLARLRRTRPGPGAHPVVDEVSRARRHRRQRGDRARRPPRDRHAQMRLPRRWAAASALRTSAERRRQAFARIAAAIRATRGAVGMSDQSESGSPARANTGSSSAASSLSVIAPARRPGRALARAVRIGGENTEFRRQQVPSGPRHCPELLAFECRQTTPGPSPASRKNGSGSAMDSRAPSVPNSGRRPASGRRAPRAATGRRPRAAGRPGPSAASGWSSPA